MGDQRHVRLFRNGRNQAVRILEAFELPGDEAIMHRDGDRLVIEPVRKRGLMALLASMTPIDAEFPEIEDPLPTPERIFRRSRRSMPAGVPTLCEIRRLGRRRRGWPRRFG